MRAYRFHSVIAAGLLALLPASVQAQDAPSEQQEQDRAGREPIVVEAERPSTMKEVKALARTVGANVDILGLVPRFKQPLCLDVAGLKEEYQERFVQRVNENARRAGLKVAEPGCRFNAMVLFAGDSRKQLEALRKSHPNLFGEMPRSDFRKLIDSRDKVYAWQINELTDVDGREFDKGPNPILGYTGVPFNRIPPTGRLSPPIRLITRSSAVVIEKSQTEGKTVEQLADYATMRLIAPTTELPPDATAGGATIMTLFANPAGAPKELTAFDRAYLESTYKIRPNGPSGFLFYRTAQAVTAQSGQ